MHGYRGCSVCNLGRVQEQLGIKKTTVEASDGSQFVFRIEDLRSGGGKLPGGKKP